VIQNNCLFPQSYAHEILIQAVATLVCFINFSSCSCVLISRSFS
jgi:hypothetical protein